MSTDHGVGKVVADAVRETRDIVTSPAQEQPLDLFDEPSSEDVLEARERLGPNASHLEVVRDARTVRRGRPPNARNKRTDDLVAYLSQFGPDPAVAAMRIIAETEELMMARSSAAGDGKRRMTFGEARSMRMRMIEHMTPYFHGKKPVAIDLTFAGISDLIIAGQTHSEQDVADILDAEFAPVDDGGRGE